MYALILIKLGSLLTSLTWLLTVASFGLAWATSIGILMVIGRSGWMRNTVINECEEEWATCCGGNSNNKSILVLQNNRSTLELKKKLDYLMDSSFINNMWCSKWSLVSAKYIYWTIQNRGGWTVAEVIGLEYLVTIEMAGTALVAITKKQEQS